MDQDWIKSPTARRVLVHWADARPAWLWSEDGAELVWRNEAAALFAARARRPRSGQPMEAVPIRGQIARLMRLGTPGRTSLSRVQFLSGERPLATTCHCTPLTLPNGAPGLLIVGVDPVASEQMAAREADSLRTDRLPLTLFPAGSEWLLVNEDGQIVTGSSHATEAFAPQIESEGLPPIGDGESGLYPFGDERVRVGRYKASPQDAILLIFSAAESQVSVADEVPGEIGASEAASAVSAPDAEMAAPDVPSEPVAPPEAAGEPQGTAEPPSNVAPRPGQPMQSLSELFDALMVDEGLYEPLGPADEHFAGAVPEPTPPAEPAPYVDEELPPVMAEVVVAVEPQALIDALRDDEGVDPEPHVAQGADTDAIGALIVEAEAAAFAADEDMAELPEPSEEGGETASPNMIREPAEPIAEVPEAAPSAAQLEPEAAPAPEAVSEELPPEPLPESPAYDGPVTVWRITGRGFTPAASSELISDAGVAAESAPDDEQPEALEAGITGLSADEMAGTESGIPDRETVERVSRYNFDELGRILADRVATPRAEDKPKAPTPPSESSLVSLPGETLVLNRLPLGILIFRDQQVLFANRAMTELLGHESIESLRRAGLESVFPSELVAGPVTRLVKSDGSALPVSARLQSIGWNGKPALMLSAATSEARLGHEAAVRTFAELAADTAEDGFLMADRTGLITLVSLHGRVLLGKLESELEGRAIAGLVAPESLPELRAFLERPARFAETARPAIVLPVAGADLDLVLFAEGQAGIIAGYFGFIRRRAHAPGNTEAPATGAEIEPSILARISRGLRRPLNTVIGFADMIRTGSEAGRAEEYATDIKSAGEEMALLVGELDDYTRLSEGRYPLEPDEIDLASLLETCLVRVRGQAAHARVFVRSAVSEHLPHISADRASLTQAVLNLLASAIDQTPPGGSVILSAQREDNGAVVVNVRDSGDPRRDLGERFVVFRDGLGRDGEALQPVRSSVGLALTRSLLAVNALKLTVDPAAAGGTLFSLFVPPDLVRVG